MFVVMPHKKEFIFKALNIIFPLILICLNVVEGWLFYSMTSVIVGVNEKMLNLMP